MVRATLGLARRAPVRSVAVLLPEPREFGPVRAVAVLDRLRWGRRKHELVVRRHLTVPRQRVLVVRIRALVLRYATPHAAHVGVEVAFALTEGRRGGRGQPVVDGSGLVVERPGEGRSTADLGLRTSGIVSGWSS